MPPGALSNDAGLGHRRLRSRHDRRPSSMANDQLDRFDGDDIEQRSPIEKPAQKGPVSWMSLPRKDQLFVLFLGRLADFLQVASLQAYVFYQLKDMDGSLSDSRISERAGILQGCFTGAQVCTAILWGKIADASWCGRKWALVIGLGGTALSCVGYGFSTTFFLGGVLEGVWRRTMISEITIEKKYQSRAFLLLPLSFNAASMLGPVLGGILADPTKTLPNYFSAGSMFGFQWIQNYPYALPSLLNAFFLGMSTIITILFLEETSKERRALYDPGLHLASSIKQFFTGGKSNAGYIPLSSRDEDKLNEKSAANGSAKKKVMAHLPFHRIWTRNVCFTLINSAFYDFQLGAFTNIWSLYLSTPRYGTPSTSSGDEGKTYTRSLPLLFTGGLGMPASTVGVANGS
ncbi:hypothetical protein NM208_g12685 [Fusarium decemcellulare]|uniref:Uncharacterized protein n=1 Tax=Fusarium decemcellulare TaxID=57161 RepID=A0ACC1RR93_9HYPO|nr:hypothetical protein NM208_g12685 [Fusarium decemcellulare]